MNRDADGWTVVVGTRVVGVFADLDAAVGVAEDLGGALVPWQSPVETQEPIRWEAA